jgi:hypothetical protein
MVQARREAVDRRIRETRRRRRQDEIDPYTLRNEEEEIEAAKDFYSLQKDQSDIYAQVDSRKKHRRRRENQDSETRATKKYRPRDTNVIAAENGMVGTYLPASARRGKTRLDLTEHGLFESRSKRGFERSMSKDGEWLDRNERLQMYLQVFRAKASDSEDEQVPEDRSSTYETRLTKHRIAKNKVRPDSAFEVEYPSSRSTERHPPSDIPPLVLPPAPTHEERQTSEYSSRVDEKDNHDVTDDETCYEGLVTFLVNSSLPSFRVFGAASTGTLRR